MSNAALLCIARNYEIIDWQRMDLMKSRDIRTRSSTCSNAGSRREAKWNESGFRPPLCTYRLNWARRTPWGWWDDWDDQKGGVVYLLDDTAKYGVPTLKMSTRSVQICWSDWTLPRVSTWSATKSYVMQYSVHILPARDAPLMFMQPLNLQNIFILSKRPKIFLSILNHHKYLI